MTTYPAPRVIPAGKILIGEYGDPEVKQNRAVVEKIEQAPPRADLSFVRCVDDRGILLVWSSPGFQPAGSALTWTNGFWGVLWYERSNGSRHGQRYRLDEAGEADARAHFARLTSPDAKDDKE